MEHTPYGYRIVSGKTVIDEQEAANLRKICENYLSGMSFVKAAADVGITMKHCGVKHMIQNKRYLGDDFYPAILTEETARTIHEDDLQAAVVTAVNNAWSRKDTIMPQLRENIRSVLEEDTDARIAEVDAAVKQKQAELLDAGRDQEKIDEIGDAIMDLREKRQKILTEAAMRKDVKDRIDDLASFLDEQIEAVTEYSETLVRRLIEKITVFDEILVIEFKSGLQIEVEV